ncbi:Pnap_2097 family protein [Nitrogeniibacter aestuarii]|uniref:Pnap_2097 family protein n=1 Tax=Nitrogeniibacter aestuarii TaxID=2815343 RepID=UPI001E2CEC59|nr:Pnap_2097 family protein [Nitrogeniibacter aestuarii]
MFDAAFSAWSPPDTRPATLPARVRVGMPQLGLNGLSESWLLAECGDRHWQLLAEACGQPVVNLRDGRGRRVYAAFRAIRLRQAALERVGEGDLLSLDSRIGRISRTQCYSKHVIACGNEIIATLEMQSVFVARERADDNTSAVRSAVPGFDGLPELGDGARFADLNRQRSQKKPRPESAHAHAHSFAPQLLDTNPSAHFNGAGFMYFARFHEFADQAESRWFGRAAHHLSTTERHILFHGNANPGARLVLHLHELANPDGRMDHHIQMARSADGVVIADIYSQRCHVRRVVNAADNVVPIVPPSREGATTA